MKIVFLCSDDISNKIFIHTLKKYDFELLVFVENNGSNKKKLIKKKYKKLTLVEKLFFPLDILFLVIYKKSINKHLKKSLKITSRSLIEENFILTNDINSTEVYENIKNFSPDVIIVRGTTIIKKPLINTKVKYFLNIHGGIVPNYRNVHGQFWSYYHKDYSNMGSSILHLSKGIDNGNIALMSNLQKPPKSLKDLHLNILTLSNKLTEKLINNLIIGEELESTEQNREIRPFYGQTPNFFDFMKLFFKI
jgi:methionyl-tRNA formyltransferase